MKVSMQSNPHSQLGSLGSALRLPLLILAVALMVAALLVVTKSQVKGSPPLPMPTTVRTITAEPASYTLRIASQGTVEPRSSSALISEVSGMVSWISPMMVSGGRFNRGDTLIQIDARDYQNALSNAESILARAVAEQAFAKAEHERLSSVHEKKLASDTQLQQAKRNLDITGATLLAAQAGVEQAQRNLERTEIKAPFTGRVRSENVDIGQVVMRGGQLGVLYATDAVEVRLPIADSQLRFLDPVIIANGVYEEDSAPTVELNAHFAGEERRWFGKIVRAEGEIDQRSRLVHLVARVRNDDSHTTNPLPVGLFVNAEITGNRVPDLIKLPRTAIRANNQVLIVAPDNTVQFRTVTIFRFEDTLAFVKDGLSAGEQVVVSAIQFAVDGMSVVVQN